MNLKQFTDNHLINFAEDQLQDLFDWNEIKKLSNNEIEKSRIELLSQYMVGNVSETFEEINKMEPLDKRGCLETWVDVVKDVDTLKSMFKSIIHETIKGN